MRKFLKITGIAFVAIVLLLAAGLSAAALLFDPNDYREQLAKAVSEQTGRDFRIEGELSLSLFPWLAVDAGAMELANAEGFTDDGPFARFERAAVGIELLPLLLRREVVLDDVALEGLTLNLAVDAQGNNNWSDLAQASAPTEEPQAPAPEPPPEEGEQMPIKSLAISGINIQDAALTYRDAAAGTTHRIEAINLSTGRVEAGQPTAFDLSARYAGDAPALNATLELSSVIHADIKTMAVEMRELALNLAAEGASIPQGEQKASLTGTLAYNGEAGTLQFADGRLQAAGVMADLNVSGKDLTGSQPSFSGTLKTETFSPRSVADRLAIALPPPSDDEVLQSASADMRFEASTSSARIPQITIKLDDTTAQGNAGVTDFGTQRIVFDLALDTINIDRYLPEQAQVKEATGEDAPKESTGSINDMVIPVEMLEGLNAKGTLTIGELVAQGMAMRNVTLAIDAPIGQAKVQNLTADLYGGTVNLESRITPGATPRYDTRLKVDSVAGGDLVSDFIGRDLLQGLANMELDLRSSGRTVGDVRRALDGTVNIRLSDGAVKGFDIARTLRTAYAQFKGQAVDTAQGPAQTDFASLVASATIEDGVLRLKDLDGRNPLFRLLGDGTVNLVNEELNVLARPSIVKTLEGQGGAELSELAGIEIPIRVSGGWSNPKVRLDLKQALQQQATEEVREKVDERKEELREKARKEEQRLQEKLNKELGEDAGKAAGDVLRNLFGGGSRGKAESGSDAGASDDAPDAEKQESATP